MKKHGVKIKDDDLFPIKIVEEICKEEKIAKALQGSLEGEGREWFKRKKRNKEK